MKRIGIILSGFLLLATAVGTPLQVLAASNSIGVNPRRDYTVAPGDKINDTLFVNNLSKTDPLTVKLEPVDFKPQDQTGTPSLLLKQTEPTRWSLKSYLSLTGQYTIAPGQSKQVPFTVSIPAKIGAGSYYSAIRYLAVNPETGKNVSLSGSAVTLVFVRVSGEAKSNLSLENFGAFTPNQDLKSGVFGSFFSATKPKYVSYLLRNNGNIAEQPTGSIMIKDMFGTQYKLINDANPSKNLVLIDQTRRIDVCLNEQKSTVKNPSTGADVEKTDCSDPSLKPGRYTATIDLVYGGNGNTQNELKQTATFWYLPVWFILGIALVLIVITVAIIVLVRRIQKRNAHKYRGR